MGGPYSKDYILGGVCIGVPLPLETTNWFRTQTGIGFTVYDVSRYPSCC